MTDLIQGTSAFNAGTSGFDATVNTGMFNSAERLTEVLGEAGRVGWELVTVYDKSSNWFGGMEKGFMLLRREVPEGVEPEAWSIQFSG